MHGTTRIMQRRLLRGGLVVAVGLAGLGLGGSARSEPLGQPTGLTFGFEDDDGVVRVKEGAGTANTFPKFGDPGAVVRMQASGIRGQINFYYRTTRGTATPNLDYYQCPEWGCGIAFSVVPMPATIKQAITLPIADDDECEDPETFAVELFKAESNGIPQPAIRSFRGPSG